MSHALASVPTGAAVRIDCQHGIVVEGHLYEVDVASNMALLLHEDKSFSVVALERVVACAVVEGDTIDVASEPRDILLQQCPK